MVHCGKLQCRTFTIKVAVSGLFWLHAEASKSRFYEPRGPGGSLMVCFPIFSPSRERLDENLEIKRSAANKEATERVGLSVGE